jgi:DNA-directed RNA polymerase specialized sigma24 family protein
LAGNDNGIAPEDVIRDTVRQLDAIAKARLVVAAEQILVRHPRLAHIGPEDLLQEALLRILDGRRKWCPTRIGFLGCVIGAMRSIASAASKSAAKGKIPPEPLATIVAEDETSEFDAPDAAPSVEESLIAKEERAILLARLDAFHQELAEDKEAMAVYEQLCRGIQKRDIRAALGMSDKDFWTIDRRLSRLIDRHAASELDTRHQ